jgi:hypothetical protein
MKLRHVLVPLAITAAGVTGIQGTASSAPLAKQYFTMTANINDESGGTVVASGAINATGEDVVISDTEDQFVFPDGTLTVIHAPVRGKEHFNDNQCSATFRQTGTFVISEGTGQYEGVTGSGTYRFEARLQDGCSDPPIGSFTISARGSVNLPSASTSRLRGAGDAK